MPSSVLVTGATGLIGRKIVEILRARGERVRVLAHRAAPSADGVDVVWGDLLDRASLAAATAGMDVVVHAAAVKRARNPRRYREGNVDAVANLLAAAQAAGVRRFVHISTTWLDPAGGAYCRSKAEAERAVQASELVTTVVRLPELYGAGHDGLERMLSAARRGRPIPLIGTGGYEVSPIHVDDAAAAVAAAVYAPAGEGKVYTLKGEGMLVSRFARELAAAAGGLPVVRVPVPLVRILELAGRLLPVPIYPDQLAGLRSPKPPASPDAAADLGFRPRPLDLRRELGRHAAEGGAPA